MGGVLMVQVQLDWSGPGHYDSQRELPCQICKQPTRQRDNQGSACDQKCAEGEIARELVGHGQRYIVDERGLALAALVDERFTTTTSGEDGRR
jgi:hypothetical protein